MNDHLQTATVDLANFLGKHLPVLSEDWWNQYVVTRLSPPQQRFLDENHFTQLEQLDFAALLRVLDQNWYELSKHTQAPREGRNWLKELQLIRNKWAHRSSQAIAPDELYRDLDTLGRFLKMLGAPNESVENVETEKMEVLKKMSSTRNSSEFKGSKARAYARPHKDHSQQPKLSSESLHTCERMVKSLVYLEEQGFTQQQLSSVHHKHLKGEQETFAASLAYFSDHKNLQKRNTDYAERLIFIANKHKKNDSDFPDLINQALNQWPLA